MTIFTLAICKPDEDFQKTYGGVRLSHHKKLREAERELRFWLKRFDKWVGRPADWARKGRGWWTIDTWIDDSAGGVPASPPRPATSRNAETASGSRKPGKKTEAGTAAASRKACPTRIRRR